MRSDEISTALEHVQNDACRSLIMMTSPACGFWPSSSLVHAEAFGIMSRDNLNYRSGHQHPLPQMSAVSDRGRLDSWPSLSAVFLADDKRLS